MTSRLPSVTSQVVKVEIPKDMLAKANIAE